MSTYIHTPSNEPARDGCLAREGGGFLFPKRRPSPTLADSGALLPASLPRPPFFDKHFPVSRTPPKNNRRLKPGLAQVSR